MPQGLVELFSACAGVCTQLQSTRHRRNRARSIRALAKPMYLPEASREARASRSLPHRRRRRCRRPYTLSTLATLRPLLPPKANSDSIVRPLNAHKTGAASWWIGLISGRGAGSCSRNEAVIQPERGSIIQYAVRIRRWVVRDSGRKRVNRPWPNTRKLRFAIDPLLVPQSAACSTCIHCQETESDCTIVEGGIKPNFVCNLWKLKPQSVDSGLAAK